MTLQKSLQNSDLISRIASRFLINARSSQLLQAESLNHYLKHLGWLHLPHFILPKAILPYAILTNVPFYPMPFYPMLFDLFVQLSNYKLAVAITRMIYNICGQYNPMFSRDSLISSLTGLLFYSRLISCSR